MTNLHIKIKNYNICYKYSETCHDPDIAGNVKPKDLLQLVMELGLGNRSRVSGTRLVNLDLYQPQQTDPQTPSHQKVYHASLNWRAQYIFLYSM